MTKTELLSVAKPILFNTPMVQAILDGRKTQTRRIRKKPPFHLDDCPVERLHEYSDGAWYCGQCGGDGFGYQYGKPPKSLFPRYKREDYLYVRETWAYISDWADVDPEVGIFDGYIYRAGWGGSEESPKWHPSIHMPKEAARIFLRVTDLRCERLRDMPLLDVWDEGTPQMPGNDDKDGAVNQEDFAYLWDSTVKPKELDTYGWKANPYVWVYKFERIRNENDTKNN